VFLVAVNLLQRAARRKTAAGVGGLSGALRHLGPLGLFLFAILDSSPLPTFGGPDILLAILAARHRTPWQEYAALATAGSIIGAYITFTLARRAGSAYLDKKFGHGKVARVLKTQRWGTGALALSTAIPFPFPTSAFFAAAGASNYSARKFFTVVALCRGARYSLIALLADRYGRRFIAIVRHPDQYWGWLLFFAVILIAVITAAILADRKLKRMVATSWS
jgi:membrane protein YqaA with SNARE-associated domain